MPYAIVMLHNRVENLSMKVVVKNAYTAFYGEDFNVISVPVIESTQHPLPINTLTKHVFERVKEISSSEIVKVIVEANYSNPGSFIFNDELLDFMKKQFPRSEIIAVSSTPDCLISLLMDPRFSDVSIAVKNTDILSEVKESLLLAKNFPEAMNIEEFMDKYSRRIYTGKINMSNTKIKKNVTSAPILPRFTISQTSSNLSIEKSLGDCSLEDRLQENKNTLN